MTSINTTPNTWTCLIFNYIYWIFIISITEIVIKASIWTTSTTINIEFVIIDGNNNDSIVYNIVTLISTIYELIHSTGFYSSIVTVKGKSVEFNAVFKIIIQESTNVHPELKLNDTDLKITNLWQK